MVSRWSSAVEEDEHAKALPSLQEAGGKGKGKGKKGEGQIR